MSKTRLAVWGSPISHSRSPVLHAAAYRALGLDWEYERAEIDAAGFPSALASLGPELRGLSLTSPLKGVAFAAAATRDHAAALSGAVNTLLMTGGAPQGFNTDVGGIVADLREHGVDGIDRVRIVGAGATATSAVLALAELGARQIEVLARRPEAAAALVALGQRLDLTVDVRSLERAPTASTALTVSVLPGGVTLPDAVTAALAAAGGMLYDVVYGQWPTTLAVAWRDAGGSAVNGLGMLLHQAVRQIRIFVTGDADEPLPDEDAVVAVMRRALMED